MTCRPAGLSPIYHSVPFVLYLSAAQLQPEQHLVIRSGEGALDQPSRTDSSSAP